MPAKSKFYFNKLKHKSQKGRDYAKVTRRLMYILSKLDSGKEVSTSQLADDLGVSFRTIQRDIEILNESFPLCSIEKGKHSFQEGFSLKRFELTEEQASLLSFMHEIAGSLGANFENSFRELLKRVISKETDSPYYAKFPQGVKLDEKLPFVKEIEAAIDYAQKINLEYQTFEGKDKSFKLNPLKIALYDGFWYLIAQVDGKDWILKLRLERIKKVEVLQEAADIPENLKVMLDQSVNIWFPEKRNKKAILRIGKEVSHFFKQKVYFPLQNFKKTNKDGSLIIECKCGKYEEIMHTVMHWIPHIVVIGPPDLKKAIKLRVEEYRRKLF